MTSVSGPFGRGGSELCEGRGHVSVVRGTLGLVGKTVDERCISPRTIFF